MAEAPTEESVDVWQKKCSDQEEIIATLTAGCLKVINKHEELLSNFQTTQDQYHVLVGKLKDQQQQVKKARDVLVPVMREYQELKEKYDTAISCQREAESYASKVNSSNVKMKRQSQMIMSKLACGENLLSMNLEDFDEVEEEPNKYYETLDKKIEELSAEKASLVTSVKDLTEDLEIEREKNAGLKKRLDEYRNELKRSNDRVCRQGKELVQLAHTSEAALHEYKSLQEQFEQEVVSHHAANTRANKLRAESMAAKRQSAALLTNISGDQKLMKALIDIEELTTKYETDKQTYESKIEALEQELQEERDKLGVQALQEETESLTKERDSLLEKLAEAEKLASEAQTQHSELQEKYSELEEKYEEAMNEPKISVPPPPPPPPPAPPVQLGIMALIAGGKKKKNEIKNQRLQRGGVTANQNSDDLIAELKKGLGGGQGLRPVRARKQSLPEERSAALELEGILKTMKRAKSEDDLSTIDDPFLSNDTELGRTFSKILQKNKDTAAPTATIPARRPTPKAAPRPTPRPSLRKLSSIMDEDEHEA